MATTEDLQRRLSTVETNISELSATANAMQAEGQAAYKFVKAEEARLVNSTGPVVVNGSTYPSASEYLNTIKDSFMGISTEWRGVKANLEDQTNKRDEIQRELDIANNPAATVKSLENTNIPVGTESIGGAESYPVYDNSTGVVATPLPPINNGVDEAIGDQSTPVDYTNTNQRLGNVPDGAEPVSYGQPTVVVRNISGKLMSTDIRTKLIVPPSYLKASTGIGTVLETLGGVLFPYTPNISFSHRADFKQTGLTHSNMEISSYQKSSVSTISVSGKFTVHNDAEARIYLSTLKLLKILTKMLWGDDANAGAPPPICKLVSGGQFLDGVPVCVASVASEFTEYVDYYTLGKTTKDPIFGVVSVPVLSTIKIDCLPMFSRTEMQKMSVTKWLSGATHGLV